MAVFEDDLVRCGWLGELAYQRCGMAGEQQIPCEDDRKKGKGSRDGRLGFPTHAQSTRMNGPPEVVG